MDKRTITVTITDDRSDKAEVFRINTQNTGNEFEFPAILQDIVDRMYSMGKYEVRSRMDDLPESDQPY